MGTSFFSEQVNCTTIRVPFGYIIFLPSLTPLLSPTTLALSDQMICTKIIGISTRCYHPPLATGWKRQNVPIVVACGITPPVNCLEASKGGHCRGLRYHPPCYHTPCGAGGML